MKIEMPVLSGRHVRLEPLGLHHLDGLMAAAKCDDPELYRWTFVPQDREGMRSYIEAALSWQAAGTAAPYVTVLQADGAVIGCTRFFDLARWDWPAGHARHASRAPDVGEIGYTWLTPSAVRTAANTEAKLLMLTQAFETWDMVRVCLQTHARNERSRAAILRIGGKFEGIIRASRLAPDNTPRDSARFSIVAAEWPEVRGRLMERLGRA